MIWANKTHKYSATICRHTGKTCPAAAHMARKLADAVKQAEPLTADDFEISGTAQLSGCPRRCSAKYTASHSRIRLFAGVDDTADDTTLNRLADALLTADSQPLSRTAGTPVPCAMVDVRPATGKTPTAQPASPRVSL